ncbi:MAG: hypothetical protein FWF79_02380 [Defluviitaleaceae bacterium]|nr:hypothetical protein [Defluviitaleaceae bacterium]
MLSLNTNILTISACKANYVPKKINATSVSPSGNNPTGKTAEEIANIILDRKIFSSVPIELHMGIFSAKRDGNMEMFTRGMESWHNLRGSTLLKLQAEAEEGSLFLELINERLEEFRKEFGEPIPNYIPFIPPNSGNVIFGSMAEMCTSDGGNTEESGNLPPAISKEDAAMVQDAIQKYATSQSEGIPTLSEEETAELQIPLTEREKALAKMFKINEKRNESFRMTIAAMESGDEAKKAEARELRTEARRLQQEHAELFTSISWGEFFYAMYGKEPLIVLDPNSFMESRARHGKTFMDIPQGEFSFSEFANALLIGMGSKIPMGHFNLHVYDNTVGAFQNHVSNPQIDSAGRVRSAYTQALNWLLHASKTGHSSLNTSHSPFNNDTELNRNVLSLLQKMGVDTSRDFSINGTTFNVRNGRVETQGYTPFVNPNPIREYIGADGMRQIFARAHAQNLFG